MQIPFVTALQILLFYLRCGRWRVKAFNTFRQLDRSNWRNTRRYECVKLQSVSWWLRLRLCLKLRLWQRLSQMLRLMLRLRLEPKGFLKLSRIDRRVILCLSNRRTRRCQAIILDWVWILSGFRLSTHWSVFLSVHNLAATEHTYRNRIQDRLYRGWFDLCNDILHLNLRDSGRLWADWRWVAKKEAVNNTKWCSFDLILLVDLAIFLNLQELAFILLKDWWDYSLLCSF